MFKDIAVRGFSVSALFLLLAACGGGGGGGGTVDDGSDGGNDGSPWERRTALSDPLSASCHAPRGGNDPYNGGQPYPDEQGSLADERDWLRTYMDEVYLWYEQIPNVNPNAYTVSGHGGSAMAAMDAYFEALLVTSKDAFSFTYPTAQWNALSQSGESVSYGAQFVILAGSPPRELRVAYADPETPADAAGLARGAELLEVDGASVVHATSHDDIDTINAGLYPSEAGETHTFKVLDRGADSPRTITLSAEAVRSTPVPQAETIATDTGLVGYLVFNEHIATAEGQLFDAITRLRDDGIDDLVLDLRYNGGGYLDIASELAYMIAGGAATAGKAFERLSLNDHNPLAEVTEFVETAFHDRSQGFDPSLAEGTALPELNLPRVFVLTGPGTCSASEAVINGLRGIDVDVVMIGDRSCGKPYGFFAQDNCGLSYFAIEFEGVNDKGEGGYANGIAADCVVADDFDHALGDVDEARLAAALDYRQSGACPSSAFAKSEAAETPMLIRSPVRENAYARSGR